MSHADPFVLRTNRARRIKVAEELSQVRGRSQQERLAAKKSLYENGIPATEEHAAMAGVATLEQTDATFIDLNIRADDTIGDAFVEWQPLKLGEVPVYKTRYDYPVQVNFGHLGGGPPQRFYETVQSGTAVTPFQYFTDETQIPNLVLANFDLAKFKEREKAFEGIARAIRLARQKIILNTMFGQPLFQALSPSFNAYAVSNPFNGKNVYILDPDVQAGSVPTTNVIDLHGEGGLTRNVFMKQQTYANQADRKLVRMFIPVSGAPWEAYWQQASIVAYTTSEGNQDVRKAIPPSKWEEVINQSFRKTGGYMKWFDADPIFVQPSNAIPASYWLTSTTDPGLLAWDQLDLDVSEEESIRGNRAMNRRYEARSAATAQPAPLLLNFVFGQFNGSALGSP